MADNISTPTNREALLNGLHAQDTTLQAEGQRKTAASDEVHKIVELRKHKLEKKILRRRLGQSIRDSKNDPQFRELSTQIEELDAQVNARKAAFRQNFPDMTNMIRYLEKRDDPRSRNYPRRYDGDDDSWSTIADRDSPVPEMKARIDPVESFSDGKNRKMAEMKRADLDVLAKNYRKVFGARGDGIIDGVAALELDGRKRKRVDFAPTVPGNRGSNGDDVSDVDLVAALGNGKRPRVTERPPWATPEKAAEQRRKHGPLDLRGKPVEQQRQYGKLVFRGKPQSSLAEYAGADVGSDGSHEVKGWHLESFWSR